MPLGLVAGLHARGFTDFSPAFPPLLSNLDLGGTSISVLAGRAGVSRQAAGQLVREIERCGYIERTPSADDARVIIVRFTARGRKLLGAVFELVDAIEAEFAGALEDGHFERVREGLHRVANRIDPKGDFGPADEPASPPATTRSTRRARSGRAL